MVQAIRGFESHPLRFGWLNGMRRMTLADRARGSRLSIVESRDPRARSANVIRLIPFNQPKRRGWDSNPRMACTIYGFQDRPNRPLWHPSLIEKLGPGIGDRVGVERPPRIPIPASRSLLLTNLIEDVVGHVDRDVHGDREGD